MNDSDKDRRDSDRRTGDRRKRIDAAYHGPERRQGDRRSRQRRSD